jgi:hypothetical protein
MRCIGVAATSRVGLSSDISKNSLLTWNGYQAKCHNRVERCQRDNAVSGNERMDAPRAISEGPPQIHAITLCSLLRNPSEFSSDACVLYVLELCCMAYIRAHQFRTRRTGRPADSRAEINEPNTSSVCPCPFDISSSNPGNSSKPISPSSSCRERKRSPERLPVS